MMPPPDKPFPVRHEKAAYVPQPYEKAEYVSQPYEKPYTRDYRPRQYVRHDEGQYPVAQRDYSDHEVRKFQPRNVRPDAYKPHHLPMETRRRSLSPQPETFETRRYHHRD